MAFVHDFLDIPVPPDTAIPLVLDAEGGLLTPPSKSMRVVREEPYRRGDGWVVPFHWYGATAPALFPVMSAELYLAPLGPHETGLSFSGTYLPPLGGMGRMADMLLLHRVVERSVRAFLLALAAELERPAALKLSLSHA
jgi:hypothetical protein